jgi:TonB family protein
MRTRGSNQKRERREISVAFLLSLFLHLLLLLVALMVLLLGQEPAALPIPDSEEPMEITFLPPPEPPATEPTFFDTTGLAEAEQPPEDARFESDRDTAAASAQTGQGAQDLPAQDGVEEPFLSVIEQRATVGPEPAPSEESPASPPDIAQLDEPREAEEAQEAEPTETAEPMEPTEAVAEASPEPTPEVTPEPAPEDIALQRPPEVRRAQPVDPSQTPTQVRRAQPPSPARPPGYQPERRVTRIEGGVNNRGASSVAAMATPLGRYKKALSDAIGSRWYFYVRSEIGLFSVGTAVIRFHVLPSGRVTAVQVLSNSSNESFASVTIRSIMEADIPPIPPDVSDLLENNRIEVDFTFSILAN